MSEHEGFCLPAIEAMHFGLPVIAYGSSALPDTIGGGGIIVTEKKHPEIAELISKIHEDAALRSLLVQRGRERVQELQYDKFKENVSAVFGMASKKAVNA
jgi:glycosyltransferase involved in cell wall biosynthesis